MLAARVCRRVASRSLLRRSLCLAGLRVRIVEESGLNRLFLFPLLPFSAAGYVTFP